MSLIDLHNYEAFLLDYSEGTLDAATVTRLRDFVNAHPELEIDLEDLTLPCLPEEQHSLEQKNVLKKDHVFLPDETLLNYLEQTLEAPDRERFELLLSENPDLARELALYQKTRLVPDTTPVFDQKERLYKTEEDLILSNRLIASLEGLLSVEEQEQLDKELSADPALKKESELLARTILTADQSLIYPDKEALKKETRVIALFSRVNLRYMAASVLLVMWLILSYRQLLPESRPGQLVRQHPAKTGKPVPLPQAARAGAETSPVIPEETPVSTKTTKQSSHEASARLKPEMTHQAPAEVSPDQTPAEVLAAEDQPDENLVLHPSVNNELAELTTPVEQPVQDELLPDRKHYLLLEEEGDGEEPAGKSQTGKKKTWKRMVFLAQQVNKLGIRSVDGQEDAEGYRLSFHSFSVEKK
jgi:hypothetical protein